MPTLYRSLVPIRRVHSARVWRLPVARSSHPKRIAFLLVVVVVPQLVEDV